MRQTMTAVRTALLVTLFLCRQANAQGGFDSGSTGSFGAINVTSGQTMTLTMPSDGIFNATTITVPANSALKFSRNALNTPVYLLATGDVTILGVIDVSGGNGPVAPQPGGLGGPGGFDGGTGGFQSNPPGSGAGPGGGLGGRCDGAGTDANSAGAGSYGSSPPALSSSDGAIYGSPLLVPIAGGSGGGGCSSDSTVCGGYGGGGGGGAILIASNTKIVLDAGGLINANGGPGCPNISTQFFMNWGSGGAIRLVAPEVRGTGQLHFNAAQDGSGYGGGDGRARIDTIVTTNLLITSYPAGQNGRAYELGSLLQVFLPTTPRLDIVSAAGTSIAEGSGPVQITLPFGSPQSQQVTVRAHDFTGIVPIAVAVIPASGTRTVVNGQIDMSGGNPSQTTIGVTIPENVVTEIQAWTR